MIGIVREDSKKVQRLLNPSFCREYLPLLDERKEHLRKRISYNYNKKNNDIINLSSVKVVVLIYLNVNFKF